MRNNLCEIRKNADQMLLIQTDSMIGATKIWFFTFIQIQADDVSELL